MENLHKDIAKRIQSSAVPFMLLLCGLVGLAIIVLLPFLPAITWAALLSFLTYPLYKRIRRYLCRDKYPTIAAALNTGFIVFLLVIPMAAIGFSVAREGARLYHIIMDCLPMFDGASLSGLRNLPAIKWMIENYPQILEIRVPTEMLMNAARFSGSLVATMSKEFLGNVASLAIGVFIVIVSSFFFTRDGEKLVSFFRDLLPLTSATSDALLLGAVKMIRAIFFGIVMTAAIQGILGGIGWWFVGLNNPVFFGFLMFMLAMIPFIGTPLVWIPGSIYLFVTGQYKEGVLLLIWGFGVVSMIDNFIRPYFISEGSKASILLVFLGILGGISIWGFLGLFIGPLVLSLSFFILRCYRIIVLNGEVGTEVSESSHKER